MKKMTSRNDQGFMLLTVIVMIMALTVVVIGFMSISVSQVTSSQSIIDSIKAEEEAKGFLYRYHTGRLTNTVMPFVSTGVVNDSGLKEFSSDIIVMTDAEYAGSTPNQTDLLVITTTY